MEPITLSVVAFIAIVVLAFIYASVKIVQQYERILIFTLVYLIPE